MPGLPGSVQDAAKSERYPPSRLRLTSYVKVVPPSIVTSMASPQRSPGTMPPSGPASGAAKQVLVKTLSQRFLDAGQSESARHSTQRPLPLSAPSKHLGRIELVQCALSKHTLHRPACVSQIGVAEPQGPPHGSTEPPPPPPPAPPPP